MKTSILALALLAATTLTAPPAAAQTAKRPTPGALPPGVLGNIQLSKVRLEEIARLLSQVGNANVVVTSQVSDEVVSLYLKNASVDDMVRNVCRAAGVWYRYDTASKTYVIMSASEYQKDLAIVRDEKTQIFTLRHHNVVSTAHAIKALFGSRVALSVPVEEMPPTSLGSGSRTNTGGRSGGSGGAGGSGTSSGNRAGSGNNGSGDSGFSGQSLAGQSRGGASGQGGGAPAYDPAADLARLSLERLAGQSRPDAGGQAVLASADIQDMAARQGPAILVTYNKLNNLLMVRSGDEQALKEIGKLVADMDKPPKQVLLEMKILEVTLDDGYRSAFDIGLGSRGTTGGSSTSNPGVFTRSNGEFNRNAIGAGLFGVEDNANLIWQVMSNNLSLRLQLLANENKLKILSSPMLVAANNQPARLFIGDERVLTVGASSESATGTTGATNTTITVETEKRDVGQTLAILPRINGDRTVSLTVDQDSSTVRIGDATIPLPVAGGSVFHFPIDTVNTASLQVTAHAKDGMTVAIGGMIRETVQRDDEKVPVLGDVPVLGFFFKRDVRAKIRTQIVLLITPRIIGNPEEGDSIATAKTQDFNATTASFPATPIVPKLTNNPPALPASGITAGRDGDSSFATLARAAATAVRQKDPTASPPEGLRSVPLNDHKRLQLTNGMEARPSASWQRDGLYVTALQVINLNPQAAVLAPTSIRGRWSAMVLEKQSLDASGGENSWTWAYAISRQPFEQAVEKQ